MIFLQDRLMPLEISTLQFHVELLLSVSENLQQKSVPALCESLLFVKKKVRKPSSW